jgi:hypothetical protein
LFIELTFSTPFRLEPHRDNFKVSITLDETAWQARTQSGSDRKVAVRDEKRIDPSRT